MSRASDLRDFYALIERLEEAVGGKRTLGACTGRSGWPRRGVYFFFEPGERRTDTGNGLRVVRVGTHALKRNAGTELWDRLRGHRGVNSHGGGNHRGSVFRDLVGAAFAGGEPMLAVRSWKEKHRPKQKAARAAEHVLECLVSEAIRAMPLLWVEINDHPGPDSGRASIERNAIALLSNYDRPPLDPPSRSWLGRHCDRDPVCASGLWNNRDVEKTHEPGFLRELEGFIAAMERA